MKKQIRRSVFETNSSSMHSLTFSNEGLEPSYLQVNEDGEIHIELGEFGTEYRIYKDQYNKLSYLLTCLYCLAGYNIEEIYQKYEFSVIEKAVCDYTGAKALRIDDSDGRIEHQSAPVFNIEIIDASCEDTVIGFIFSKYVWLKTDRD